MAIYHRALSAGLASAFLAVSLGLPLRGDAFDPDPGATMAEAWLSAPDAATLRALEPIGFTVAEGRRAAPSGGWEWRVLASERALDALAVRGVPVRIERVDHTRGVPAGRWHTPDEGDAVLEDLASRSTRAGLAQLGTSVQGRPITGLWIGAPPDAGAPAVRVLGAHHGDEWSSFEVALDLAATLVSRDGADPAVTELLDTTTVWIVPFVNPDGVMAGTRYNATGVDLNRNYDFQWSPTTFRSGPTPFSEPETRAVRVHATWTIPYVSLSLHSGAANIGYVWNYSTQPTPEEALVAAMADTYAEACDTPGFWVTNGADWYVTRGDTNDWSYGRYGGMDFTVELTEQKTPDERDIPGFLDDHREAVLALLLARPTLAGRVVDAETGAPVAAGLRIDGGAGFTADPVAGAFHRAAGTGPARLRVEAPGYAPATLAVTLPTRDLVVRLERAGLASGRPTPRMLPRGAVDLTLPVAVSGPGRLVRTGYPDVPLDVRDGRARVDGATVAAGPWTVSLDDGHAWPNAVHGPSVPLTRVFDGDALTLSGAPFARGTRVYGLWSDTRTPVPLGVISEAETALVVDASDLPPEGDVDLVVVSDGQELSVVDLYGPEIPRSDTGDSGGVLGHDTGPEPGPETARLRGGCACTSTGSGAWAFAGLLAPLVLWRRRR